MKKLLTITILTCIVFNECPLQAQWVETNGPTGGFVNCLWFMPKSTGDTDLFAGTNSGVFRSYDNGQSWKEANTGITPIIDLAGVFEPPPILALASIGDTLFAGTNGAGVFVSIDSGTSWTAADSGLSSLSSIYDFALSPNGTGDTNIYAAAPDFGIFASSDRGKTWSQVDSGLTNFEFYAIAAGKIFNGITNAPALFLGTVGGVFVSTNEGTSWRATNLTTSIYTLATMDSTVFAAGNGFVYRSTDRGETWTPDSIGLPPAANREVYALSVSGSNLFAGVWDWKTGYGGAFFSIDKGKSWNPIFDSLNTSVQSLAVNGSDLIAGTDYLGMYRAVLSGTTWSDAQEPIEASWIQSNTGLTNSYVNTLLEPMPASLPGLFSRACYLPVMPGQAGFPRITDSQSLGRPPQGRSILILSR